jgi:hypothetical protein
MEGTRLVWVLPMPAPHEELHAAAEILQHALAADLPPYPMGSDGGLWAHSFDSYLLRYSDACALVLELRTESGDAQNACRVFERALKELALDGVKADTLRSAQLSLDAKRIANRARLDCELEHLADSVLYQRAACAPVTRTAVNALLRDAWARHARLAWTSR